MKISAPKENYIFIELTGDDMKKLNITYSDMDYSNVETRRVIWTLLDEARQSLGKELEVKDDMKIEALPSLDGGCLLFFTINQKPVRYKLEGKQSVLAYRFDGMDALFDLSSAISEKDKAQFKSSLYHDFDGYIVVISGMLRHSLIMKFNEFGIPLAHGKKAISKLTEYRQCLIFDKALNRLSGTS